MRIGTRGSPLALAQAEELRRGLAATHPRFRAPDAVVVTVIRTSGDRIQDRPLAELGGKGLFTKEIEEALLDGRVDCAAHSMKDLPTWLPAGLTIGCLLPREDPRDALFAREGNSIASLPRGAVVGTASLRRAAQLLAQRPDLRIVPLRGNVGTRLAKLEAGAVDATLLALAGLKRLGLADRATAILAPEEMLPAVAQGAIGIEIREGDSALVELLAPLDDPATAVRVAAERACLAELDGSCHTPIAALAEAAAGEAAAGEAAAGGAAAGDRLRLRALIALPDGSAMERDERHGPASAAAALGRAAGLALKARAAPTFFRAAG